MEKIAADHLIDITKPAETKKLDYSIRSALALKRPGLACSVPEGEVMTWRAE